jgi:thiol-disulfide isomerase/thioredoxin
MKDSKKALTNNLESVTINTHMKAGAGIPDYLNLDHAEYPPSSLSNFEKCPGWRNRADSDTEASKKGTRIHKALEKDDLNILPEEERTLAQVFKDYIDGVIAEKGKPDHDYREVKFLIDLGNDCYTFGTADRMLIYGTDGFLFDFKTGYREIADAKTNAQGWAYVIGAFQKYEFLQNIEFTFLVPNRDEVLYHPFNRAALPEMRLRLNTIIQRARAIDWSSPLNVDFTKLSPQPELCEYCQFQATCPALARKALNVGAKLAPSLPVPTSVLIDPKHPEDIPHLLRLAPLLENWASEVRKAALKLNLEEGIDIPGFTRIERSTPRGVTSVLGAWDAVKDVIDLEDFLSVCGSVSVPSLEDFFAAKAKRLQKGKAREQCNNRLRTADVLSEEGTIYYLREKKK